MERIPTLSGLKTLSPDLIRPLVILVGPTAVGKTELSIQAARELGAEIICADSRQFYRGMDIGTAKPTLEERNAVPHHLFDIVDPDQTLSLAEYQQRAQAVIGEIHARGRLPMLVGGTGQYVRCILEGWVIPKQAPNAGLRDLLERWGKQIGAAELHRRLGVLDAEAARKIEPENVRRTVRALEVIYSTGRLFSEQRTRSGCRYSVKLIGLSRPRAELYRRIDARIEDMFTLGLVDEVRGLLEKGYDAHLPTLSAIGYREVIRYLHGELSLDEAKALMRRQTRVFVRRQANWFKPDDPDIRLFPAGETTAHEVVDAIRDQEGWILPNDEGEDEK